MTRRALIHRRNGSDKWYVRVQVPIELQPLLGKSEIWKSLKTADRKLANRLAPARIAEVQQSIDHQAKSAPRQPSRTEIEDAVRRFYADEVAMDMDERGLEPDRMRLQMENDPHAYKTYADALRSQLVAFDYSHVLEDAKNLCDYEGFTFAEDDASKNELLYLLMRARLEAARRWTEHGSAIFGEESRDPIFKTAATPRSAAAMPVGRPLLSIFEDYAIAKREALKPNTIDDSRKNVLRFSEFVGMARPADQIARAEARAWRDLLRDWPQYANQATEFAGLDFAGVLEINKRVGRPPISVRTMNKYVADLSSFFDWMSREDHVKENVFRGLSIEQRKGEPKTYPFSVKQLNHLLQSPLLTGCLGDRSIAEIALAGGCRIRDWRYWILILAMFTGARQGELAQLELSDIASEDGVDHISINDGGDLSDKSIKALNSRRRVPIHSRLVEFGFLEYVATCRQSRQTRLFPETHRDSRGYFSDVSKFYQKYFDAIGLRQMEKTSTKFHSFRHGFIDELRIQNYQDEAFKSLIGHAGKSVTSGYGVREVLGLKKRKEVVESVRYQGIDFSFAIAAR